MTSTEQTEQDRVTNAATIAALVELAVRDGILAPTHRPMNGTGTDYVSVGTGDGIRPDEVKIGTLTRDQYGVPARVYVHVTLAHRQGQPSESARTHKQLTEWWELSISAGITTAASRREDDYEQCGQSREPVAMVANGPEFLPGFVKAWDAYHLNGMSAGCDHQTVVWEDGPYGRRPSLEQTPLCPESGYRYGSKWLVRDLPADVVQTVLAFLRQAHAAKR
jgi:hypothetical protein